MAQAVVAQAAAVSVAVAQAAAVAVAVAQAAAVAVAVAVAQVAALLLRSRRSASSRLWWPGQRRPSRESPRPTETGRRCGLPEESWKCQGRGAECCFLGGQLWCE